MLAGLHSYFWYEEVCAQALEKLGHEVLRYRWHHFFKGNLGVMQEKWLFGPSVVRLNRNLVAYACAVQPDVIFLWRGTPVWPTTLRALKSKTQALLVSYNNDDPFGPGRGRSLWRHFIAGIPVYDRHFVYRRVNIGEYRAAGGRNIEVLLPYYIPEVHRPIRLTPDEQARYACDLVFVGHYENDGRVDYVRALVKAGLHVRLFGSRYWSAKALGDLAGYFGAVSPALDEEYVKALSGAKLCLAFLSKLNRDTYTRRSFEIPACGAAMISERTDDLTKFYEEGEEAVFFASPEELVEKATALLAHGERRTQVAQAGHDRCINDGHDVMSRMRQFCRTLA